MCNSDNDGEMLGKLMSAVAAAKENGTFSAERLDDFAAFAAQILDDEAIKRLYETIEMLKNG